MMNTRPRSFVLLLSLFALVAPSQARSVELSIHDLSVSSGLIYGNAVILPAGETVTIGVRVDDPTLTVWVGLGLSYYGYDGSLLGFVDGEAVPEIFANLCFPAPLFCIDSIPNLAGSSLPGPNRTLEEVLVFPGVPLTGTPRVRGMFAWRHVSNSIGSVGGPNDYGIDGVLGGGDAHMRTTFVATGNGYTTITIGTGDDLGGIVLESGGVYGTATNTEIRLAVPEPGFAAALALGFGSLALAASAGRRRLIP